MICTKCKREYKRSVCEFCSRENQWDNAISKKKIISSFTPRIRKNLLEFDFSQSKVKLGLDKLKEGKGLFMYGNTGSKKTSYAAYTILEWLKIQYVNNIPKSFAFVNSNTFTRELKNTFRDNRSDENDIIQKYANADVLLFDDVGVDKSSEWLYSALYSLINYRYDNLKYETLLTSNISLKGLEEKWGDSRITSRIKGDYFEWNFGEIDYR